MFNSLRMYFLFKTTRNNSHGPSDCFTDHGMSVLTELKQHSREHDCKFSAYSFTHCLGSQSFSSHQTIAVQPDRQCFWFFLRCRKHAGCGDCPHVSTRHKAVLDNIIPAFHPATSLPCKMYIRHPFDPLIEMGDCNNRT